MRATPYEPRAKSPPKTAKLKTTAPPMERMLHTELSIPAARPLRMIVAGPVRALLAISVTGGSSVCV